MTSADLAAARMCAPLGPCRHERTEPVELTITGEVVGHVCTQCLTGLPVDWDLPGVPGIPDGTEETAAALGVSLEEAAAIRRMEG